MQPGEFGWIEWMRQQPGLFGVAAERVLCGPGDDCAVFLAAPDRETSSLFALDMLLEGTHFAPDTPAASVAYKLLAANLSDVAAMGGVPRFAVTGVGLPPGASEALKTELYHGLADAAQRYGVALLGGDVTAWPAASSSTGGLVLSLALLGEMEPGVAPVLRSGARPGDVIAVTGELGGSLRGKHLCFEPRLEPGRFLARERFATAMLDLSDGLASDLAHICKESGVGATLEAQRIPVAEAAHARAQESGRRALEHALSDGEDFELCFTVPAERIDELEQAWPFAELPLTRIGKIRPAVEGRRLRLPDGTECELIETGWDHLQPPGSSRA